MTDVSKPAPRELTSTAIVYLLLLVAVVLGAVLTATVKDRSFFATGNIEAILVLASTLGLVAIGQTLVILVGSLDLSVPYVVTIGCIVGALVMDGSNSQIVPGVLLALLVTAGIGLVNGVVVAFLGVHGFIATLGMGLILSGYVATEFTGDQGRVAPSFQRLDTASVGPIPVVALIMLAAAALAIWMLSRTRLGHHMYAVGGSKDVARLSGLRTWVPVVAAHVLCSALAGLAGVLLLSRIGVGKSTAGLTGSYELMSIAAVVLGGTLLAGGKGSVLGTLGGVLIFAVMDQVMSVIGTTSFVQDIIRGAVIVLAVAVYASREVERRPAPFDKAGRRAVPAAHAPDNAPAEEEAAR